MGLYTATVLAKLEEHFGGPIARHFDLIAGTSVGGIIALGLAAECPASEIASALESEGQNIFSSRSPPKTAVGKIQDFLRSVKTAKYRHPPLRAAVEALVPSNTLIGDLKHPIVVPTVNLTKGGPQIFKTPHHVNFQLDHRRRVSDVALATSAAPTYFPIAKIGDELFVDGGLYANSPDLIALHEAEKFFGAEIRDIRILSIGTTTSKFSFSNDTETDLGLWGWGHRLPETMIAAQQMDVFEMAKHRLGDRYLRIDEVQSKEQEKALGLDIATEGAKSTIRGIAQGSFQQHINSGILSEIFRHKAPDARMYYGKWASPSGGA